MTRFLKAHKSDTAAPKSARRLGRFVRAQDGTTAVEFALLGLPFFAIVGAILETALVFFAAQVLDSATDASVRLLRTGQAQSSNYTISEYRTAICDHLFGLFDCTQLKINVSTISDFSGATYVYPLDPDDGTWQFTEGYAAGGGSSIVKVQVYYKWPTFMDFFSFNLSDGFGNSRLLGAARVFKNEPF